MKSINYVVAVAAILFAASVAVCFVTADDSTAAVGDTFTEGDYRFEVLNETDVKVVTPTSLYQTSYTVPSQVTHDEKSYNVVALGNYAFSNATSATSFSLPNTLVTIGDYAFNNDTALTAITLPGVISIGANAFYGCTHLESVEMPHVVTIGNYAFNGLKVLSSVDFGDSLTSIGSNAFYGASALATPVFPETLQTISQYAFYGCISITTLVLPDSLTTLDERAFYACSGLTSVTFGSGLAAIGTYAFSGDGALTQVTFGSNLETIGENAFNNCSIVWLDIPDSVRTIGYQAFYSNDSLTHVTLGSSVATIGNQAFTGAFSLVEILNKSDLALSAGSSSYGNIAYYVVHLYSDPSEESILYEWTDASGHRFMFMDSASGYVLTSFVGYGNDLTMPADVVIDGDAIGSYTVFSGFWDLCGAIVTLHVSADVAEIKSSSFSSMPSLQNLAVDSEHPLYSARDNLFLSKDGVTLIRCPSGITGAVTIPVGTTVIGASAFQSSRATSVDLTGVVSIGDNAFFSATAITTLTIPSSVVSIGNSAFAYMTSLVTVDVQAEIDAVPNSAFKNDSKLETVTLSGTVTKLGSNAFDSCYVLTSVPGTAVTDIGAYAMRYTNLGDLSISATVETIGNYAFYGAHITSVTFPNSVRSIGQYAFQENPIATLTIPESVTTLSNYAFYGMTELTSVTINAPLASLPTYVFRGCVKLEAITLPSTLTSIESYALEGTKLASFTIPDSVRTIGSYAFRDCTSLTTVDVGRSVTSIGSGAFSGCTNLTTVNNNSFLNIVAGESTYGGIAQNATSVNGEVSDYADVSTGISYSVNNLGHTAIVTVYTGSATELTLDTVTISDVDYTVIGVGDGVFNGNSVLTAVTLGSGITSIGAEAFMKCTSLASVDFSACSSLLSIGSNAFNGCSVLTEIDLSNSTNLSDIGVYAFATSGLESAVLGGNSLVIRGYAFYNDTRLTTLEFTGTVTSIGLYAFNNCRIETLDLPEGLKTLSSDAFRLNTALTTLSIPASLTNIFAEDSRASAFAGCNHISTVTVAVGNTAFVYENGLFMNSDRTIVFFGTCTQADVVIPASVREILSLAFQRNAVIETLSFESGSHLTAILQQAFQECPELRSVTLPDDASFSINMSCFESCPKLVEVDLGTIRTIGQNSFYHDTALTSVEFPDTLRSIEYLAFSDSGLTSAKLPVSLTTLGMNAFSGSRNLRFIEFNDSCTITAVSNYFASGCDSLEYVHLPDSITTIGNYAFSDCKSLKFVNLPSGVTSIPYGAFSNCYSLDGITLPSGVTSIASGAFNNCKTLTTVFNESALVLTKESTDNGSVAKYATSINPEDTSYEAYVDGTTVYVFKHVGSSYTLVGYTSENVDVVLPDTVHGITGYAVSGKAFMSGKYASYTVSESNTALSSDGGVLYSKDGTVLVAYPAQRVADTIRASNTNASYGILNRPYFAVPATVSTIGDFAFFGSSGLIVFFENDELTNDDLGEYVFGSLGSTPTIYVEGLGISSLPYYTLSNTPYTYVRSIFYVYEFTDGSQTYTNFYTLGSVVSPNLSVVPSDHMLVGWDSEVPSRATFSGVQTFTATLTPKYSVRLDNNNGSYKSVSNFGYGIEKALPVNTYSWTGYLFGSWNTMADGSGRSIADEAVVTDLSDVPGSTVTLYAIWVPVTYSVIFDGNGATSGSMENQTLTYNKEEALDANEYVRTGYTFRGWATNSGNAYIDYRDEASRTFNLSTTQDAEVTLYALWQPISYTVVYNLNGAAGSPSVLRWDYDVNFTLLDGSMYSLTGYTFGGWATAADGPKVYDGSQTVSNLVSEAGSITLYAVWVPNTYSIRFQGDGATGSMDDQVVTYDVSTPLNENQFAKEHYYLQKWRGPTGIFYEPGDSVLNLTSTNGGSVTLTAVWAPVEYAITYNLNGGVNGSNLASYTYVSSDIVFVPATKTGYEFGGWFSDSDCTVEKTGIAAGSSGAVTVYAKWTPVVYTVTYVLTAGTNAVSNPATYTIESDDIVFAPATKAGYTFGGWFTTDACTVAMTGIDAGSYGNVRVFAKWTPIEYTITYNLNGGTNAVANPTAFDFESDDIVFAPATKAGYTFGGWFTDSECTVAKSVIENGSIGNVTVYAKWTPVEYAIAYNLNGGVNGANPATYNVETATIVFAAATKNGYDFGGWYSDSACTVAKTSVVAGSTGDVTVYAKWTAVTYTLTYNLNGGTNVVANPATYTIESSEIVFVPATKAGYTFGGWFTDSECTVAKTGVAAGSTGDVAVYAKWAPVTYNVTYNLNGGVNGANPATYNVETATIVLAAASKVGYDFLGWFTEQAFISQKTQIALGSTGDVELFAKWAATEFAVTYNLNGGTNAVGNPADYTIESSEIEFAPATKTGYTFGGWFTDSECTVAKTGIAAGSTGPVTVYAKWTPVTYSITYNLDGGVNGTNPETYNVETATIALASATRTGYHFLGWFTEQAFINQKTQIVLGSTGNVELFAKWAPWTAKVAFYGNGADDGAVPSDELVYDVPFTLPANNFVKAGKVFMGWARSDAVDAPVVFSDRATVLNGFTDGESFNLYAVWGDRSLSAVITLDGNPYGGLTVTATDDDDTVFELVETGAGTGIYYTFDGIHNGWYAVSVDDEFLFNLEVNNNAASRTKGYFTVSFDSVGGSSVESQVILGGQTATVPAAPTKAGYTFNAWMSGIEAAEITDGTFVQKIEATTQFTATWAAVTYAISYNLNGGVNGANPATYTVESSEIVFDDATKNGYDFGGWYSDSACTVAKTSVAAGSTGDVTVYAKWTATEFAVTYNLNGGVNGANPATYTVESSEIVFAPATKTGYDFAGWYTDSECTVAKTSVAAGSIGDVTVYAKWTPVTYSITYNLNGGVNGINPATYTVETATIVFAAATKENYDFIGWYTEQEFTNKVTKIASGSIGDVTVYALWLPATYTISYNLNGGVNGANPATYTVESSEIVFAPATKTGYDFAGWYTDSECTVAKTGIAAGSTGAVTVYAMWAPVIYTVSYNLNGGENGVNPVSYTIESSEIVFEAATKTGYDFAGWYTDSECTVAKTGIAAGSTGDVALFAKWTPVKYAYAVNYLDMDDNVIAEAVNGTADYASSVVAPLKSVTGYTCTESEAASITISSSVALNVYTYRFTVNQYDVVYQVDGEQVFSDRFAFGTEVTVRPVFDKTGYDVTAWSGVAITDGKFTLGAADVLLTATSTVQEYTVSFNANGGTGVMENVNFTYAVTGFVQPVCGFTAPADKEFIGWALEADGAAVAGNIILTSDVTLYAVWGLTEIDIAFDANTGVGTMAPIHFTRGDSVTITNSFTKEHYDFIGWNTVADGSGASYANGVDANLVSTSCTLYAQWQIQTFTLTYMVDEEVYASDVYDWNTVVTVLPVIEKTGYTVSAWTGAEIVDGKVTIGSDVTLTSTTTVNQYAYVISYVSTSTVVLNQQIGTADYGSSVVAPVVEIVGYTCDSTVRNILIKADAELNTMTYIYAPVTYTIAYELNGGTAVNDTEYTIESADIVFAAAVRDAYEFAGWFTDSEFTNARASIATGSTGDVTVYAKWTPVTYNVTYVNTDGAVNSNVTTYTVESAEIVFDDATKTGYDFAGWFADSACTVAKAGIAAGSAGDVTVYAKWAPVTYSITYMDVEGAVNSNPVSYTIENGFTLTPASKDGSRFVGWFYTVEARQSVDNVAVGTTGDLVFYAVWAKNVSEPVNNTVEIAADEGKDYVAVVLDTGLDLNSVVVKFNNGGSVSFPTSVLSKAGTVTMKQVDKSILTPEAQEKVGSAPVFVLDSSIATNFGSDVVTVSLPYAGEVKDGQTVVAYWIKDNGELEAHDAVYNSATKTVDFTTNHFSNWTIKVFDAPAPAPSENNGGGSNTALILGVVAVVIVAALGALFFLDQKGIVNILPKKKE